MVSAAEFETQGKGWFGFDHTVDFRALLLLSEKLTQDIISRANQAKGLADKQGRLEVPFNLSGKLPGAKPKPEIGYIAQAIGKGAVERVHCSRKNLPREPLRHLLHKTKNRRSPRKKRNKAPKRKSSAGSKNPSENEPRLLAVEGEVPSPKWVKWNRE